MVALDALLVVLRESLEAFLILGILTGIVTKLGHPEARRHLWGGALAGFAASIVAGIIVLAVATNLFAAYEEAFEGFAALAAVAILTYMVVWMYRHTLTLLAGLRSKAKEALRMGRPGLLFGLAFVAVFREGIETVLFLGATVATSLGSVIFAVVFGIGASALLAWLLMHGTMRLSLRGFFTASGALLILFGGGLLATGVHELGEAGILPETKVVYDSSGVLNDDAMVGSLAKAAFGYRDHPRVLEMLVYVAYVGGFMGWYMRGVRIAVLNGRRADAESA